VYQIVEEIGHGGMGEVYRAVRADGQYEKQVAIKLVRGGYDTAVVLERFLHERQILASLDHPNIARLYDGGTTAEGLPYLVMELCRAGSLNDLLRRHGPMAAAQVRDIGIKIADALAAAHLAGVLHRDIKPANILVNQYGVVGLSDFGLASIIDASCPVGTLAAGSGRGGCGCGRPGRSSRPGRSW